MQYAIGKYVVCNDGNDNTYNLGVNALHYDVVALKFKSTCIVT